MTDRAIIANASTDPVDFFYAVTGRKRPTEADKARQAARDQAWQDYERGICKRQADYWSQREHNDRCAAEYAARLAEIAEDSPTECAVCGTPLDGADCEVGCRPGRLTAHPELQPDKKEHWL